MHEKPQNREVPQMSPNEATQIINGILSEIMPTGATDSEMSGLRKLIGEVTGGKISPEDGVRQARELQRDRMSYH